MTKVEETLASLGITLPEPVAPVADYVPFVISGHHIFVSGQISVGPDGLISGTLGSDMSLEAGIDAARICGINILSQLNVACDGDLGRVNRIVKLGGFVSCIPSFTDHPKVINGASSLMRSVFGDAGRHARAAVGVPSLPLGAAVEIDAVVEIAG
ncbi:MAG: RidA family protein [Pseudomonadota bacterium]